MKTLLILALVILGLALAALAAGFILPPTREGRASADLPAPAGRVRAVLLDWAAQPAWRGGIARVEPRDGGGWREVTARGEAIDFTLVAATGDRIELSFRSDAGYFGTWVGTLTPSPTGTRLDVTESATVPNPVTRLIARLFFDPAAFARAYLDDLNRHLAKDAAP